MMIMKSKEFKDALEKERIDAAIFYNLDSIDVNPNFFYFTGYSGIGALVIPSKKEAFLLAPKMEYEKAKLSRIKKVVLWNKKRLFDTVSENLRKRKISANTIGIDFSTFTLEANLGLKKSFPKSKIKDAGGICRKLRMFKTPEEIDFIRKGCKIADGIFSECIKNFSSFKTESDVAAFLEYKAKKLGYDVSFKPIVASGKGSSMPHYVPRNIPLRKGFCVIDFGIKYNGYCTDMTRTIYIGKPSQKEIEIYNIVLDAEISTVNAVRENIRCAKIYEIAVSKLGKYKKNFIHGLGHGVGVEIHEMPNLKPLSKDKLENNFVFTVEPGVYFPERFGIRIEDTVALVNGKVEVLTKSRKELVILE